MSDLESLSTPVSAKAYQEDLRRSKAVITNAQTHKICSKTPFSADRAKLLSRTCSSDSTLESPNEDADCSEQYEEHNDDGGDNEIAGHSM